MQKPLKYPGEIKNKTTKFVILLVVIVLGLSLISWNSIFEKKTGVGEKMADEVLLKTNFGDIKIKLYDDMPITTGNFRKLVEQGVYGGVIFHRVIDEFMIQGGDPTGTGYGDPSIAVIPDEFRGHKNNRGTIAMANKGPNTGSSQFFINLVDNNYLDDKHPVFGEVVEGMDVVDKIAKAETDANNRPLEEIKIIRAEVL